MIIRSGITGKTPWTREDDRLFTDLPKEDQEAILKWIKDSIIPGKSPYNRCSSYGLKHMMEYDIKLYTTNNQFKHAMLIAGYKPVDEHTLNWVYRISGKSPAVNLKAHGYMC